MKKCPYCGEEVEDAAIDCQHCEETLAARQAKTAATRENLSDCQRAKWAAQSEQKPAGCFFQAVSLLVLLFSVGLFISGASLGGILLLLIGALILYKGGLPPRGK